MLGDQGTDSWVFPLPLGLRGCPRPSREGKKKTKKSSFLLSRVFPFTLMHENQPELFQYRLLSCRLAKFIFRVNFTFHNHKS